MVTVQSRSFAEVRYCLKVVDMLGSTSATTGHGIVVVLIGQVPLSVSVADVTSLLSRLNGLLVVAVG